ncbi:MAG: hypothetical protein C0401_07245 [Anaerolinea sp.]|nr:hypothetical protein [Anaerolinea sp.]
MKRPHFLIPIMILLATGLLAACGKSSASDPAKAVEDYWQALVAKDSARLSSLSCAAYESTALTTLESFQSVDVALNDLACTAAPSGDSSAVTCAGNIVASYGSEDLVIDLSERTYSAVKEGGDWRMCGEQ